MFWESEVDHSLSLRLRPSSSRVSRSTVSGSMMELLFFWGWPCEEDEFIFLAARLYYLDDDEE